MSKIIKRKNEGINDKVSFSLSKFNLSKDRNSYGFYTSLKVDKIKDTFYTGGNICVTSDGSFLFCICGASIHIIDTKTGLTHEIIDTV